MSGTVYPMTQNNIPEDLNLQHHCENLSLTQLSLSHIEKGHHANTTFNEDAGQLHLPEL
jgi:hypothetical protein